MKKYLIISILLMVLLVSSTIICGFVLGFESTVPEWYIRLVNFICLNYLVALCIYIYDCIKKEY
jgi:branched-subunit amino acid transport protein